MYCGDLGFSQQKLGPNLQMSIQPAVCMKKGCMTADKGSDEAMIAT
jgi:hypothetical protein